MIDKINDQLSAMLDDELDERECELLLTRMGRDPGLRDVWERYSLIGDCVRGNLPEYIASDMAGRVAAAVARNEAPLSVLPATRSSRWRPAAGIAIAASVAVLAIVTLGNPDSSAPEFSSPSVASAAEDSYTVPVINMREQVSAAMRERLNFYQVSHSEFAGPLQRRAVLTQISGDAEPLPDDDSGEDMGERQ